MADVDWFVPLRSPLDRVAARNVCLRGYDNDPTLDHNAILTVEAGVIANLHAIGDSDIVVKNRTLNPSAVPTRTLFIKIEL